MTDVLSTKDRVTPLTELVTFLSGHLPPDAYLKASALLSEVIERLQKIERQFEALFVPDSADEPAADTTEVYYAHMEGMRAQREDEYFEARPQLMRSPADASIFRAGFERGYEARYNRETAGGSPVETSEQGWLIEAGMTGQGQSYVGIVDGQQGGFVFVFDADRALRFSRKEDAESVMNNVTWCRKQAFLRVAGHEWVPRLTQTTATTQVSK